MKDINLARRFFKNGLEIFLIVGILSIITFYFISRTLLNKKYKKITYLTPAIAVTVASLIFLVLTFILSKDGWVIISLLSLL